MVDNLTFVDVMRGVRRRLRRRAAIPFARPEPLDSRDLRQLLRQGVATMGGGSYAYPDIHRHDLTTQLHIGRYTSISRGVTLVLGGEHRPDWATTSPLRILYGEPGAGTDGTPHSRGDIVIGNDVWIATNATILSGVTIGDGAVVGAGALVLRDVAPYAVAAGNPARVLRHRFDDPTIARLLALRWWDWTDDAVRRAIPDLCSPDIQAFLDRYAPEGD